MELIQPSGLGSPNLPTGGSSHPVKPQTIEVTVLCDPSLLGNHAGAPTNKQSTKQFVVQINRYSPSPICELKRSINQLTGLPCHLQRIVPLTSTDQLSISPTVRLTKRVRSSNQSINITIRTYSATNPNEVWRLAVDHTDSILDLKFLLFPLIGIAPEFQRLYVFQANQRSRSELLDDQTIEQSNLKNGSDLRILFEFPSGQPGHGAIHRSRTRLIESYSPSVKTIADCFRSSCKAHSSRAALGSRTWVPVKSTGQPNNQSKVKYQRGPYEWLTFAQLNDRVTNLASGLVSLGMKRAEHVGVMSVNRSEWVITDFACSVQSLISVPLYDTLGEESVRFIMNHATMKCVIVAKEHLELINQSKSACPTLRYIIVMDDQLVDRQWAADPANKSLFTHTMSQVEALGAARPVADNSPKPADVMSICYTSGTTGQPKGALLDHKSVVAAVGNNDEVFAHDQLCDDDVQFSYLPLAHIYERINILMALVRGVGSGFSQGDNSKLVDDVVELKPTVFPGVPRVWQRMYDRITAQVSQSNVISRTLFEKALSSKMEQMARGQDEFNTIWDRLVFAKTAARFGGRLRLMTSGAAPVSPTVAEFVHIAFQAKMVEGYGLTETNAAITCTPTDSPSFGRNVGMPSGAVEIKLVDVPDMNYLHTDKPYSRGEVWVRGASVFAGYYRAPELTAEVITPDGWFMTGDIGCWLPDGALKIIDRKKNLFKLAQGEYIRPEFIEGIYKQCSLIGTCYVHGDSTQSYLVAVIVPDWEAVAAAGFKGEKSALVNDERLKKAIQQQMDAISAQEKLRGFEWVKAIHLSEHEFTVENGMMTPTQKVKRQAVAETFKSKIADLYAKGLQIKAKL